MKQIVRIRKVDLNGNRKVRDVITKIKGINFMMSNAIVNSLGINGDALLGELSDNDIERLKKAIEDPVSLNLPSWLLNRRKDVVSGVDKHITGVDISLVVREDIKRMQETKSYKGFRLAVGLKVRGQRTKSHPRKGATVGVITKKKAAKMQKKSEPKKDKQKGGKKK